MDEVTVFTQHRFGTTLIHRLDSDEMYYTLRDMSGELQFSVKYEHIIVNEAYSLSIKDKPLARLMIRAAAVVGLGSIAAFFFSHLAAYVGIVVALALFSLGYLAGSTRLLAARYTMLKMAPAPPGAGKRHIRVLNDNNQPAILSEIKKRWKARLRLLHIDINYSNDVVKEINKFNWLKDNAIITPEECRQAIEKLQSIAARNAPVPADVDYN